MSDNNQTNTPTPTTPAPDAPATPSADDIVVTPDTNAANSSDSQPSGTKLPPASAQQPQDDSEIISDIAGRINDAHNILIALSADPSVDEMAAAIGLSIALDRAGKRATAIYSGQTPNALEFLKPEKTFEATADTLQDFVIAINKDKADHLRYKLDGDFVKIYITPYKTRVAEDDLEFSYGDFNIDLVLSLDVANGVDLDSALREHGRIMHDATVVNITTGNPGKFGEIEWSNKSSSSVSEMAARLLMSMSRKLTIEAEDATAFLTGIVAATNHFSNTQTTPSAMRVASDLLRLGANQQLISQHITETVDNNYLSTPTTTIAKMDSSDSADSHKEAHDATSLDILHDDETSISETTDSEPNTELAPAPVPEPTVPDSAPVVPAPTPEEGTANENEPLLETPTDLANFTDAPTPLAPPVEPVSAEPSVPAEPTAAAPAPLASPAEPTPVSAPLEPASFIASAPLAEPTLTPDDAPTRAPLTEPTISELTEQPTVSNDILTPEPPAQSTGFIATDGPEKVVAPSAGFNPSAESESRTYSQMLEDALAESTPLAPATPLVSPEPLPTDLATPSADFATPASPLDSPIAGPAAFGANPAATAAPIISPTPTPEVNGIPEMNYNMPGDILPPPPTPVVSGDMPPMPNSMPADFTTPAATAAPIMAPSPVIVDPSQPIASPAAPVSSGAFQIPGA